MRKTQNRFCNVTFSCLVSLTRLSYQRLSVKSHPMLLLLLSGTSSRSLKQVEQLQSTSKLLLQQAKILLQKMSTSSDNKATQKPKGKRGKAGTRTPIHIRKAILQRSHLSRNLSMDSSRTINMGSHKDKDKISKSQSLNNHSLQTFAHDVVILGTDRDLTVQHQSTNVENVIELDISQVSA